MPVQLSNNHEVVQTLLRDLADARRVCWETASGSETSSRAFVPHSKITELLTTNVVHSILQVYCRQPCPINTASVLQYSPRGVCILLEIGYAQHLPSFVRYPELRDDKLPRIARPQRFPREADIWEKFSKLQWEYFPVSLDNTPSMFEHNHVIPFLDMEILATGSSATLYKVTLHSEYDALQNAEEPMKKAQENRQFAMKTYEGENAQTYYDTEVENFMRLNAVEEAFPAGLLGLHTSFQHGKTYNVLFELANGGNLHNMMLHTDPPATGRQIFELWKALLEVLKALERIHEIELDPQDGGHKVFQGVHQDIRPKNILVFEEPAPELEEGGLGTGPGYSFKLADLGISHFVLATEGSRDEPAEDTMGSQTFGAPETFRETNFDQRSTFRITRSIDIWSLGCVFLTVAVWIAYGKQGVVNFQKARHAENRRTKSKAAYAFHDGRKPFPKVLRIVLQEMETLQWELKRSDPTTTEVMNQLIVRMIDPDSKRRPTAATACGDANRALEAAQRELATYYRTAEQGSSRTRPISTSGAYAHSLHYPSSPPPHMSDRWSQARTPQTPPDRSIPMRTRELSQRDHPGLWDHDPRGGMQRRLPESPPLSQPRSLVGPAYSVPHIATTVSSSIEAISGPSIADTVSEEPVEAGFEDPEPYSRDSRPGLGGHVARSSDPSILPTPQDQITVSPSLGSPYTPPPPQNAYLSVADALKHIDAAGKLWRFPKLSNAHYRESIKGRDHVFIIDNSASMKDYEQHVIFLAKVLLYFASAADPNGVDVWCTKSDRMLHKKDLKSLLDFVRSIMAAAKGTTDIKIRLGSILSKYKGELEFQEGRAVTKLSVYVLTDGAWTGLTDAENIIRETVKILKLFNKRSDQLGIQFISFGDDSQALERLDRLDKLGKDEDVGLDIVDTTDHRGNVWKMLLGAFDKTFDEDLGPSTPSRSVTMPPAR